MSGASASAWGCFVPVRHGGISEVEIDGEVVLLALSTGTLHLLNPVAAAIWSALDGRRENDAIVAELADAAGADVSRVRRDVATFLEDLSRHGLLSGAPPPAAGGD